MKKIAMTSNEINLRVADMKESPNTDPITISTENGDFELFIDSYRDMYTVECKDPEGNYWSLDDVFGTTDISEASRRLKEEAESLSVNQKLSGSWNLEATREELERSEEERKKIVTDNYSGNETADDFPF